MPRKLQETRRPFEAMRRTTCAACPAGCGVKVFVEGGRMVDLFGDEENPLNKGSLCARGLGAGLAIDRPGRVVSPLVRSRRDGPFAETDWDQAVAFVAERLAGLGGEDLLIHADGRAPFGHLLGGTLFAERFGTSRGPQGFVPAAFGESGAVARMFGVPAARLAMNAPRDWCNSRAVVLYATDPATTDPVTFGPLLDARDRGARLVVIDSKTTMTALKATHFVRVAPGSEAVLLGGLIQEIIAQGWTDLDFLDQSTTGLDALRLATEPFGVARVAAQCRVGEDHVRALARLIGTTAPVQAIAGDWFTGPGLGSDDLGLLGALVCLRGSVGVPGGGLNLLAVSPFAGHAPPLDLEGALDDPAAPAAGLICHGDPVARLAGGAAARRALAGLDVVVQMTTHLDATSRFADVVLPCTLWPEDSGLVVAGNGRTVQWCNRVVAPPGDCREPLAAWLDLIAACGLEAPAAGDGTATRDLADAALAANPLTRAVRVADLDPETAPPGGVLWPCAEPGDLAFEDDRYVKGDIRGPNILFRRHQTYAASEHRFPTTDGRIALDQVPAPGAVDGAADGGAHPLALVLGVGADDVDAAPAGGPLVRIHPRTAAAAGIGEGAPVEVRNGLGAFVGVAELGERVDTEVVWCIGTADGTAGDPPASLFGAPDAQGRRRRFTGVAIGVPAA